ncbi:MAG TPA: S9 family peptidase [Candidatus Acidoferrales bacterium]|nr:S9 family peptidase [Candidatus Acidoferrales bacterium]
MAYMRMSTLAMAAALALTAATAGGLAAAGTQEREPAPASNASAKLEPMDMFQIQWDANPQISPDGSAIVYERHFADVIGDQWHSNLWIVQFDGSDNRPLTTGNYNDNEARWSPDGKRLAYVSDRDGKPQIYLRWMDTGQTTMLTDLAHPPAALSWSPDGSQIAFTNFVPGASTTLGRIPHPPAGAKWAEQPILADKLHWRANGSGLVPNGYTQIFVVGAGGGAPHQVSHGNYNFSAGFGGAAAFNWTKDGNSLIFSANLHPDGEYKPDADVYQLSLADGSYQPLTHRFGPDNSPALSPDGSTIAYTGYDERYQGHQTSHLYLMNRDGSNPRMVMADFDRDIQQPRWAADGSGIYFLYEDRGDTKLAFATTSGDRRILASHLGSNDTSYDIGQAYSAAANGNFAVAYTLPDLPGSIAAGNASRPESLKVIANPNQNYLAHKRLGKTEEFTYDSSFDRKPMQGWVIEPPDFQPGHKYPLILEIHGGPYLNYGDRFDIEKQIYAAQGYVVVYVNPRGSTSYGEEFANLIHNDYPDHDFEDLDSGVDAVIKMGSVDPTHLYVTGGSGGGVLTCWVVDHTARYRAAMSMYPVINWYSWALTADAGYNASMHWLPGPPWENWQVYMERSPINSVGNVKTPTALMTGLEDYRTPISEAEQYYEALKMRKIDTILIRVPGEPHAISRRPSHQMTKLIETLAWFHRYE